MPIELVCKFSVSKSCCQAHLYSSIIQRLHSKLVSHLTGQNRFQITRYFLTKVKKMDREEVFDDDNLLQEKISIYEQKSIIRSAFQTFKQTLQDLNFGSNHKSLEIEFCLWLDSLIRQFWCSRINLCHNQMLWKSSLKVLEEVEDQSFFKRKGKRPRATSCKQVLKIAIFCRL